MRKLNRKESPTYTGFFGSSLSPLKEGVDMQPGTVDSQTRIPGNIGWGVSKRHLVSKNKLLVTDEMAVSYPIQKEHLSSLDKHRMNTFQRNSGDRALHID